MYFGMLKTLYRGSDQIMQLIYICESGMVTYAHPCQVKYHIHTKLQGMLFSISIIFKVLWSTGHLRNFHPQNFIGKNFGLHHLD